ncbi:hypothetical protein AB0K51_12740 [Kitasatospora sp. NPDC049285]|uniref:hypothetical protein n=1 Tax=Kitasatospora sp. NPDC049285 TaxID=3157096 RepID=UPI003449C6A5
MCPAPPRFLRLEHILISHALLAKFDKVSTGNGQLPNVIGAHPAAAHGKPSDHSPVLATFNLKAMPGTAASSDS